MQNKMNRHWAPLTWGQGVFQAMLPVMLAASRKHAGTVAGISISQKMPREVKGYSPGSAGLKCSFPYSLTTERIKLKHLLLPCMVPEFGRNLGGLERSAIRGKGKDSPKWNWTQTNRDYQKPVQAHRTLVLLWNEKVPLLLKIPVLELDVIPKGSSTNL